MDEKALDILLNDFKCYNGYFKTSTPENFEYAKSKGLMFDNFNMTHNQGIDWLFEVKAKITKSKSINSFLASLSTGRLDFRSGLPAYAVSRFFPQHSFVPEGQDVFCKVCGEYCYEEKNLNILNQFRLRTGGLVQIGIGALYLAFYLEQFNLIPEVNPTIFDYEIFWNIIDVIENAEKDERPEDIVKKLTKLKLIAGDKYEISQILETLSLCGIMETSEHKGYFEGHIDGLTREQREKGDNWGYPLRWWNGKEGINHQALGFWFGEK